MARAAKILVLGVAVTYLGVAGGASGQSGLSGGYPGTLAGRTLMPGDGVVLPSGILDVMRDPAPPLAGSSKLLNSLKADNPHTLRGTKSVQLYRQIAPAVVLIDTKEGFGSGTLLNTRGDILTNAHVVGDNAVVGVIFKPAQEGQTITRADVRPGKVVRVDEVVDLALVRVSEVPTGITPVSLGTQNEIAVGADVHAIGHPKGDSWSYTMGVISQIRDGYKWAAEDRLKHQADVIQTQTPINPGNSGGPLLTDDARLIGVNSFKTTGEGLNFAVALSEVQKFLSSTSGDRVATRLPSEPAQKPCKAQEVFHGTDKGNKYNVTGVDADCDGREDFEIWDPINKKGAMFIAYDHNGDGTIDEKIFSFKRDWVWNLSFVDTDYDGKWDVVGYHDTGKIDATRFEPYAAWAAKNP